VKNEEIEETDAAKNAEDPIQDNRSECDEEDRESPVHTDNISERNRKSSAASDASTTLPKIRKKAKTDKDTSTQLSKTGFNEWCNQLLRFKEEFGYCKVPVKYADNPSLGHVWRHENSIQENPKRNENKLQSLTRQDRASRRDWLAMEGCRLR